MGKIYQNFQWQYSVDPLRFLHLDERVSLIPDGVKLVCGPAPYNDFMPERDSDDKVFLIFIEEPNEFFVKGESAIEYQGFEKYDEQLTICPYTAKWAPKRTSVFFPFDRRYEIHLEKTRDVLYSGGIHHKMILDIASSMSRFNYDFISFHRHPLVTFTGGSYQDKLRLISRSKIQVVHNLLFPQSQQISKVKSMRRYHENEAFSEIDAGFVPQQKIRALESAFLKTLILCKRDSWNVIETMFETDEFVYWDDENDLTEKIDYITRNYHEFLPIIEKAYTKATSEYTVESFIQKFVR